MRSFHKIGIGVLVGLVFFLGYGLRINCDNRQRSSAVISGAPLGGTQVASSRLDLAGVDIRPLKTLYNVLSSLREHYVDQLTVEDEGKMTYGAIKAMLASLNDPETRFIEPDQRKLLAEAREGKFHGIGAIMSIKQIVRPPSEKDKNKSQSQEDKPKDPVSEEHLIVVSVLPGSPAAKAGLKPGDEIAAINGKDVLPFDPYLNVSDLMKQDSVRNMERPQLIKMLDTEQKRIEDGIAMVDAEKLLMSDSKKPIEIKLAAKPPAQPVTLTIQTGEMTLDPVSDVRVIDGNIGFVRVGFFGADTFEKFAAAMKEMQSKRLKGLVIDLRGSMGPDVLAADNMASWFAPRKVMSIRIRSRGRKDLIRIPSANGMPWTKPVVMLVDGSTAKAAELFAASLKDMNVAKLVGEKTFGDFSDTTLIDLADGSAIIMSSGKYVTGAGNDYHRKGVPVNVEASSDESQMKEAIKLLSGSEAKG